MAIEKLKIIYVPDFLNKMASDHAPLHVTNTIVGFGYHDG